MAHDQNVMRQVFSKALRYVSSLKRWQIVLVYCCIFLIFISAIAFWKREGIIDRVQTWRAGSLLAESISIGEEGDWKESASLAMAAWQLDAGNVEILRQLFTASREARTPELLAIGKLVLEHPDSTLEDRIGAIEIFLQVGDLVTSGRFLNEALPSDWESPEMLELGVRHALARNQVLQAIRILERLVSLRQEPADRLLLADALSRVPTKDKAPRDQAQVLISELFFDDVNQGLALGALPFLSRLPRNEIDLERFAETRSRLQELSQTMVVPTSHFLLAGELEMMADPENAEALVEAEILRWKDKDPVILGNWLLGRGLTDRVVALIPKGEASRDVQKFLLLVRTQFARKDWKEAASLLNSPPGGLNPSVALGLEAVVAEASGQRANARVNWERAFDQASFAGGRSSLLALAKLAAQVGNEDVRNRAVVEALKRPSVIPLASEDVAFVFAHLSEEDEAGDLLRVSLNLLQSEPGNPMLVNNVVWLQVIEGRVDQGLVEQLGKFTEEFGYLKSLRTTLALARIESGDVLEAEALLAPIVEEAAAMEELGPTDKAVVALVLAKAGKESEAREYASRVDWNEMLTREKQWFESELLEAGVLLGPVN